MNQAAKYAGPNSAPLGSLGGANLEPGGGHRRLQVLLCGLESANILLAIMAACPLIIELIPFGVLHFCGL